MLFTSEKTKKIDSQKRERLNALKQLIKKGQYKIDPRLLALSLMISDK